MAIPDSIIDQIQDKVDIAEIISKYIPLKKIGRSYKALCPFHHEKTPSFIVSPEKQIYHCFGCGVGGNVFSFVMRYENIEFPEAVEMLAKKAGVMLPRTAMHEKAELTSLANQLYKVNELASQYFQSCLASNNTARDYISSRGISDETVKRFKIGYAPDAWEALLNFFKNKGVPATVAEKAGLVISNNKGGHYDRFRHRIIFPKMDIKDRVLGFGARVLDSSLPKYINSSETYIYSKGKNLYGLNFSKESIKKEGYAMVVEGYLDFIIPYQSGVYNSIATLGTALTIDQVKLLKRFAATVIMLYDPDEAGQAASLRNLDIFISEDVNVYIAELPSGYDPDGYIRKFGVENFTRVLKSSKNLFDYKFDKVASRFDVRSTYGKAKIAAEMLPTISRISNAIIKSNLIKKLSERLSVDEESLRVELKKVKQDYSESRYLEAQVKERKDPQTAERVVLSLLLEGKELIGRVKEELSLDEFRNSSVRDMVKAIFFLYEEKREITPAKLISYLGNESEAAMLISEVVSLSETITDKERALADCVARIKKDNMREELDKLQTAIKIAHDTKDEEELKRLLAEYDSRMKAGRL